MNTQDDNNAIGHPPEVDVDHPAAESSSPDAGGPLAPAIAAARNGTETSTDHEIREKLG